MARAPNAGSGLPSSLTPASTPLVGIFWQVPAPGGPVLVCETTPLRDAEPYGACLGHAWGHFETWEAWRRLGVHGLARLGLPACILDHDYEDFPRGRIVYQCGTGIFILYADPRLHTPRSRARIRSRFHLECAKVRFARDAHYRRG